MSKKTAEAIVNGMLGAGAIGGGCIGAALIVLGIPVIIALANGFVIGQLWEWFLVPWLQVDKLAFKTAAGLGLIVSYSTYSYKLQPKETDDSFFASPFFAVIYRPIAALAIGWLIKSFL